jgi:tetratricopeptide (TPR) repeat protein
MAQLPEASMRIRPFFPLAALVLTACGPTASDRKNLSDAYSAYAARDFAGTENAATSYIQKQPTADNVDEAFYLRGLARYGRADRVGAAADLHNAVDRTKRSDLKYKAYMTLGDIAFDQNQWDEAAADYRKAIASAVGITVEPRVEFRLGVALQSLGQWDSARAHLALVAASRDAALAERARERMGAKAFSLQFGAFKEGARAGELVRQLRSAGINAAASSEMHNGQLVFVVRSGAYTTLADADNARKRVADKYPNAVVVP